MNKKNAGDVSVTSDGKSVTGSWSLEKGVLTVRHPSLGVKSTQIGNLQPEQLAGQLLSELIKKQGK